MCVADSRRRPCCKGMVLCPDLVSVREGSGADDASEYALRAPPVAPSLNELIRLLSQFHGDYSIHRIGHGIGMTTHEPPCMVEGETRPIVRGMCFSIEPGIYLPDRFGVRIERIVVAT